MNLNECREKIDSIDTQILGLLNRRAEISKHVGCIKASAGLPIVDPVREGIILNQISRDNPGDLDDEAAVRIYQQILDESRRIQLKIASEVNTQTEIAGWLQ